MGLRRVYLALVLLGGCGLDRAPPAFDSPCDEATHRLATCGATMPFLSNRACTGLARLTATCIVDHAANCDALATLAGRLDECLPDGGSADGLFPSAEELEFPLSHHDAGAFDAGH